LTTVSKFDAPGERRRRADAQRSATAILNAAIQVLGRRSDATMEEIAAAAGVARQTVYAHYSSREALLAAVMDMIVDDAAESLNAIDIDSGSAVAALRQWLEASWGLIERFPVLLNPAVATVVPGEDQYELHVPITKRLFELLERGQRTGELDDRLPVTWLISTVIGLGHNAGAEVSSGRMSAAEAGRAYRESVLRVCVRPPDGPTEP
jgi:AcrR family transcriptional regulator